MWTKIKGYRSSIMLVRIRIGNGFTIPVPIPLFLLDQTLDAIADLIWLAEKFGVHWTIPPGFGFPNSKNYRPWVNPAGSLSQTFQLCRELIWELRCYGKWRMVEVETRNPKTHGQVRIYVDFF